MIRHQVFVSSTKRDLEKERSAVSEALLRKHYIPAGMELFPSASRSSPSVIRRVILESDYYILIVGSRYGSTLSSGLSFTEYEYNFARQHGKRPLVFIPTTFGRRVRSPEEPLSKRQCLSAFVQRLQLESTPAYYDSPGDLAEKVLSAVDIHARDYPTPGWIRADGPGVQQVELGRGQQRVWFYKEQREKAKKTVFIFAVTMSLLVEDLDSLFDQLDRGLNIRLMCLDSGFIRKHRCKPLFNRFFSDEKAIQDQLRILERSHNRLVGFIRSPHLSSLQGKIELRAYRFFPTTNMSCFDEGTPRARMVFDFISMGNQRLTLLGLAPGNTVFERFLRLYNLYWNAARPVAASR